MAFIKEADAGLLVGDMIHADFFHRFVGINFDLLVKER